MIEELFNFSTRKGLVKAQRLAVNPTTMGLYEGINNENILWNLEFQSQPFAKTPLPIVYVGKDDYVNLAQTYCIWVLLESDPMDENYSISSLAVCLFTNTMDDIIHQVKTLPKRIDYWSNCKDFDL